ncbi:Clp protease N-terminal domain-containing protein [Kineobactrum salinum]|uniref:Clp R domain-containing protein n=1 Tax=Kineobactrum salinum TaxID=2708301 RepID=A0A6C0U2P5_9GAMM|nr:Clp protease N-terminal domain-containing protein [Kineobactrum salinum]QIB65719.1 hypothetical protein G3T16_10120 [Kineobactrum salinum]
MFQLFKRKLRDAQTLARLCTLAEDLAHQQGRSKPGSEHFILAALALPDQTAAQAFASLGLTEQQFQDALAAQRSDALASVGISTTAVEVTNLPSALPLPKSALYETEPSGKSLVKRLAETRKTRTARFLLSADVLLAAAQENYTPSTRAFQKLGISPDQLVEAAQRSVNNLDSCSQMN